MVPRFTGMGIDPKRTIDGARRAAVRPMRIGSTCCPGDVWIGVIDDVRVYNRALSAAEIAALAAGDRLR
jgi:hypothetical protein